MTQWFEFEGIPSTRSVAITKSIHLNFFKNLSYSFKIFIETVARVISLITKDNIRF